MWLVPSAGPHFTSHWRGTPHDAAAPFSLVSPSMLHRSPAPPREPPVPRPSHFDPHRYPFRVQPVRRMPVPPHIEALIGVRSFCIFVKRSTTFRLDEL